MRRRRQRGRPRSALAGGPSPNADGITARTHPAFWRVTGRSDQPKHVNALCKIHSNVHEQRARPCPDCVDPPDPLIDLLDSPCDPHDIKACDTCMAAAAQRRWPPQ